MMVHSPPSERISRERIVALAREHGAHAVGITDTVSDERTRRRLSESFQRGDLATWSYDDAYARTAADARSILPDAASVISIAVRYDSVRVQPGRDEGRVSNYAWSDDYHRAMRAKLGAIAAAIDAAVGASVTAIACDTKPLAERALAERSGIGWIGKHTNLIATGLGSFVFLGEIVTSLVLEPDAPSKKSCGYCTRCVIACPTGALRGDYTIDATRCIADLTQRTDAIPRKMRALMGTWVWGCDLCQEACPPSQLARTRLVPDPAFLPKRYLAAPELVALLQLKSGRFKREFAASAMGWRGAAVLRRNAAVALGNALDRSAVPALAQSLAEDPHPLVRGHAAWALGRIASPAALGALETALAREADATVVMEITLALEPFAVAAPLHHT